MSERSLVVADVGEKKIGVECELGVRPGALSSGLDMSQLASRACCPLEILLV